MKELAQRLQEQGIHTLLVQFTDIHGTARGKLVPLEHLEDVLTIGAGFSGPSIWGTGLPRTTARSEYYARGVSETALPLPWWPGVARIVGDGFVDGQPFEACPRQVLLRQVQRLAERGLTLQVGMEPEFFLLKKEAGQWQPFDDADRLDRPSYDPRSGSWACPSGPSSGGLARREAQRWLVPSRAFATPPARLRAARSGTQRCHPVGEGVRGPTTHKPRDCARESRAVNCRI
jgi:glutamine synthetase